MNTWQQVLLFRGFWSWRLRGLWYAFKMMASQKVVRVEFTGGIIGLLFTDPEKDINKVIEKASLDGWEVDHMVFHRTQNVLVLALQMALLVLSFGLITGTPGYMILFKRK